MQFQKNKSKDVLALIDSGRKVNVITPVYTAKLGFKMQKTDVGIQKIGGSLLKIYDIVIATFQIFNKLS